MELNTKKVIVNKSASEMFDYLTDVKNFEQLMPENISKFEVLSPQSFVFALKGMPEIALEVKEINAPESFVLGSIGEKLPFKLIGDITEVDANTSEVQLHFKGEFNSMMSMMIKGPISKFIETLVTKMQEL